MLLQELIFFFFTVDHLSLGSVHLKWKRKKKSVGKSQTIWEIEEKVGIFNLMRLRVERNCDLRQTRLTHAVRLM